MAERPKKPSKSPKKPSAASRARGKGGQRQTAMGELPPKRTLSKETRAEADQLAARELTEKVKTARGRKISSKLWLERQLNDPYVARARAEGFRSRAAYKLLELDEKFGLLRPGARVVDLGAAPGGWSQVAGRAVLPGGQVVGIDYLDMPPLDGVTLLKADFLDEDTPGRLRAVLGGPAHLVLSDMAAPTTGHKSTDHLRIVALAEAALDFAETVLAPGGGYVAKVLQGGSEKSLLDRLKADFTDVAHAKPSASRAESAEMYVVATGYRSAKGKPS